MINIKNGHISSLLIMFTSTTLRHTLLEWQRNKYFYPKGPKSKLKEDRPDPTNNFNYLNDGGENTSCCPATGRKLLTLPGIADRYTFLINTWITLPESNQQQVYKDTLATVKGQIQQVQNRKPAVVISVEAGRVGNAILLDYLTSDVALEKSEIGRTDPNIQIDNNCKDSELDFGIPGGSGDYEDERDESDECDAIATAGD
jgi:hypothetical protein